ncbi:MAG: XdhC family protein, partial [Rhabdochlamydiaceae bacterium]
GGGERSIAGPLVSIAKILNFNVAVIDPGATKEMYPEADRIIPEFADRAVNQLNFGRNTSIVIVTKHKYDEPSVRAVAQLDVPYIGLVSSFHRASALFKELTEKEGYKEEDLRKIRVPIGIDIGAQSYEEIALSIMAEIIKATKGGSGRSISEYKGVYSRVKSAAPEQVA